MKKVNIKSYYVNLTEKLKVTNPRNYFKVIKMLSGYQESSSSDYDVDELRDLTASEAAERIAAHFSAVSCSYQPVHLPSLPAYLPTQFKGAQSKPKSLIGGGPQGTLLGGIEYIIANDCSKDDVKDEERYKYFDDLHIL